MVMKKIKKKRTPREGSMGAPARNARVLRVEKQLRDGVPAMVIADKEKISRTRVYQIKDQMKERNATAARVP